MMLNGIALMLQHLSSYYIERHLIRGVLLRVDVAVETTQQRIGVYLKALADPRSGSKSQWIELRHWSWSWVQILSVGIQGEPSTDNEWQRVDKGTLCFVRVCD